MVTGCPIGVPEVVVTWAVTGTVPLAAASTCAGPEKLAPARTTPTSIGSTVSRWPTWERKTSRTRTALVSEAGFSGAGRVLRTVIGKLPWRGTVVTLRPGPAADFSARELSGSALLG